MYNPATEIIYLDPETNCFVAFGFEDVIAAIAAIVVCLPNVLPSLGEFLLLCTHSAVLFDWICIHLVNT